MSRTHCIAAVLLLMVLACLPLLIVAKWIGHFTLTVNLDVATNIDTSSITYVACWKDGEAHWLVNDQSGYAAGFEQPDATTPTAHTINITCSGESGGYGLHETYHQPNFLVVQYRNVEAEDSHYSRKLLAIPPGRGPRSTTLTLP